MTPARMVLVLLAAVVGAMPATAHSAIGQWTRIGPDGGYAVDVVNDPVTVTTSYASTFAGLHKTTDGGDTWTLLGGGLHLGTPAISTSNPNVLYAPGGSFSAGSLGAYKSVDAGSSWTKVLVTVNAEDLVNTLAVDPTNPSVVYAGRNDGLYKTTDGGGTWSQSDNGITAPFGVPDVEQVVIDPLTPSTLFAVTRSNVGPFKSTDAGASWAPSNTGVGPGGGIIAIHPQTPTIVYLLRGSVLYESTDGGASWGPTPGTGFPPSPVWTLAIHPTTPSVLYVTAGFGATAGLHRSDDGGDSWSPTGCLGFQSDGIAVRADGAILIAAHDNISYPREGGVYRSTDAGASCPLASVGISGFSVTALAVAGTLYMGDESVGAYRSSDGGVTWESAHQGLSGIETIVHDLAVDPANPSTIYQSSGNGLNDQVWKSIDAGDSWTSVRGPFPFYDSLAIDPTDADHVLLGLRKFELPPVVTLPAAVERTVDGGATWTRLELSGERVGALAFAPTDPSIVYAGTDSNVLKSVDGGATFPFGGIGIPFEHIVTDLDVDPSDASIVYAVTANPDTEGPDTVGPGGVFKSIDGGATWVPQDSGVVPFFGASLAVDPAAPSNVYLAAGSGFFRSTDGAATWSAANEGFPRTSGPIAVDPAVPGRVYVGTSGSSLFVRDFPPPCPPGPDPLCITPITRGATLKVVDRAGAATDQVTFKWAKGPAIAKPAFGAPDDDTAYSLCIYDRTPGGDVLAYRGRALPPCTTASCWTEVTSGWRFKSSSGGPDGVTRVVLKSGDVGRAKLQVKAKRAPLAIGPLPFAKSPSVVAEIRTSDGACWGATFSTALKSTSERFTARSD